MRPIPRARLPDESKQALSAIGAIDGNRKIFEPVGVCRDG
jgi:hypothetical protein